ncbi:solute carrier family 23 member 2-like [Argopecten irradians]|uniref:solute carrier family 23 member 2-like n=1 Tax=Argopecten irradians TaxID=31199 RepID=UPI0037244FB8
MDSVYHNSVNGECDGNSKYQVGLDKETTPLAMDNTRSSDLPTNTDVEDATENFRNSQQDTKLAEVLPTGTTDEDVDDSSLPPKITIEDTTTPLVYRIKDNPPIYLTIVFAIQQALLSFATQLIISLLVAQAVHGEDNAEFRGHLLGSTMFMCGFSTMAMSLFGSRLPIFQGGSAEYIIPLLVLQDGGQKHKCGVTDLPGTTGNYSENPLFYSNNTLYNFTSNTTTIMGGDLLQDNQYVDYVKLRGVCSTPHVS